MWKRIKPYLVFCGLALKEDSQHWEWYKTMRATYIKANKAFNFVLGTTVSAALLLIIWKNSDYLRNHKRWMAIVLLAGIILFLLWLVGVIKRFHDRAAHRHEMTFGQLIASWDKSIKNIKELAIAYGMINQLIEMLNRLGSKPFPPNELEHLKITVRFYLEQYFKDYEMVRDFCVELPPIPDSLDEQWKWLAFYSNKIGRLLDEQRQEVSTLVNARYVG